LTSTVPELARSAALRVLSSVDLPLPDGPRRADDQRHLVEEDPSALRILALQVQAGDAGLTEVVDLERLPLELEHERADGDLVLVLERVLLDRLAADEGAVGAAEIDDAIAAVHGAKLDMAAGNLGIVQLEQVGRIAPGAADAAGQFDLLSFIDTLDDNQTGHGSRS
jgi:hypothetical protein